MSYFNDFYPRLYNIFMVGGWGLFAIFAVCCIIWLSVSTKDTPYRASKFYYLSIANVLFLIIGLLISIFLPSPSYFGL